MYDSNESPETRRNDAVATWGENYIADHYKKLHYKTYKNSRRKSVDFLVVKPKTKEIFGVEVKTQRGTISPYDGSHRKFHCLHISPDQIEKMVEYSKDKKATVYVAWISLENGEVFLSTLDYLLQENFFDGVKFPQLKKFFDDKEPKFCFPEECFDKVDQLTDEELTDLHRVADWSLYEDNFSAADNLKKAIDTFNTGEYSKIADMPF